LIRPQSDNGALGEKIMGEQKILVVDDDEFIREIFEQAFIRSGYKVRLAESAEEALEILNAENIPVMFLDLNLPGMNGADLCRKIKEKNPTTIIHAVTGYGSLFELARCREAGFDDYFAKPVNLSALVQAAKEAFEKLDRWDK
jgi:DNA-binding response OmpR family regulator